MRLTDLKPVWLENRVGFTFMCPCCLKNRLTCFGTPTLFKEQVRLMHLALGSTPEDEDDWPIDWVPSNSSSA